MLWSARQGRRHGNCRALARVGGAGLRIRRQFPTPGRWAGDAPESGGRTTPSPRQRWSADVEHPAGGHGDRAPGEVEHARIADREGLRDRARVRCGAARILRRDLSRRARGERLGGTAAPDGLPAWRLADATVPVVGVGIAIARLGCFLHGCCFGTLCAWPWCVTFPRDTYIYQYHLDLGVLPLGAERTLPIHPLQLYFAAAGLAITAAGLWLHPRKRYDGEVALVALVIFSISTAMFEFLRADAQPRLYWGSLPQLTWIALAMSAASVTALAAAELVHRRNRMRTPRAGRSPARPPLAARSAPADSA